MILILNPSTSYTFLNRQKERKQKSDHVVTSSTFLTIRYDRIANFDLVILPFRYINSVKYFLHYIQFEENVPVIRRNFEKKEERNTEKKRKEILKKNIGRKLSKKR